MTMQHPAHRYIAVNEKGLRIGESHPRARLSDHEVDLMRTLHEEYHIGYAELAEKFECSVSGTAKLCRYERRNQAAAAYRPLNVKN